jgi:peroxisome-assembly ATPase
MPPQSLGLSITNPLILYRALIATRKIKPDPAQHRLALQLQKLYFRLKDYAPEIEYRYRLERIGKGVARSRSSRSSTNKDDGAEQRPTPGSETQNGIRKKSRLSSLLSFSSLPSTTLALTPTTPLHISALSISSPQGLLLYGEVGRGKSMLLDLLYNCLPSRKKRRWHYNTFMLDIFRRLELERIDRLESGNARSGGRRNLFGSVGVGEHEHVVLTLAKDTVCESPILFLDEFQMPDRTASKLINSFFTAFFHLGGVLVASSNRMPEELSKAAGIEFGDVTGRGRSYGTKGGLFGLGWGLGRESEGERAAKTDFGMFLEVLKGRCEVWEMEGERDWRREGDEVADAAVEEEGEMALDEPGDVVVAEQQAVTTTETALSERSASLSSDAPAHYHISIPTAPPDPSFERDIAILNPSGIWESTTLTIYARKVPLPSTHNGILKSSFHDLCTKYLGPADYVSLCSTFHTMILTDVPVLTFLQKNEARRFITLLDALYEAKCRLLISAEAPPDKLFFPEKTKYARTQTTTTTTLLPDGTSVVEDITTSTDSITSESFSEIYQDTTAPFRPNISSYTEQTLSSSTPYPQQYTPTISNPSIRTVLADEDADFGPTYGNGRSHGASNSNFPSNYGRTVSEMNPGGVDFTSTSALTGEDERFAYKRARSRLWEMCGRRWWDERMPSSTEDGVDELVPRWWMPVHSSSRTWESPSTFTPTPTLTSEDIDPSESPTPRSTYAETDPKFDSMFKHNASPFRRSEDPPPKFGWQHAWGMMKWGRKAGEWGKGVEGSRDKGGVQAEEKK